MTMIVINNDDIMIDVLPSEI